MDNSLDISSAFDEAMRDPEFAELEADCGSLSTEELLVLWSLRKQIEAERLV